MSHATTSLIPGRAPLPARAKYPAHAMRMTVLVLGLLGLAALPRMALASGFCWFPGTAQTAPVAFNVSQTIPLQNWSSNRIILTTHGTLPPLSTLYCTSSKVPNGLVNATPLPNNDHLFATGIPGIAYRILLNPGNAGNNGLTAYSNPGFTPIPVGSPGTGSYVEFNAAQATLELVYTGQYLPYNDASLSLLPSNETVFSGAMGQWEVDICSAVTPINGGYTCSGSLQPTVLYTFQTAGAVHFTAPTCTVNQKNMIVTLPVAFKSQFDGLNSTTGMTPFKIGLSNCSPNLDVGITLHANSTYGNQGVINPTTDEAKGVGIQLLKSDASTPVTFDAPFPTGTTGASVYNIQLYARYYQTGQTITPGMVRAIATYTLTYQ